MLALLLVLCAPGFAAPTAAEQAEYNRLIQEIDSLSQRDAWTGVERAYKALLETGVALRYDDHLDGAHAAAARGDVATARERLLQANALHEDRNVIEWLFNIDSSYGLVELDVAGAALGVQEMPFDPNANRAIQHATQLLEESGSFHGMLPAGMYSVGDHKFVVEPNRVVRYEREDGKKRKRARGGS